MHKLVHTTQRARHRVAIPHIAADHLDMVKHGIPRRTFGMDLIDEAIKDLDVPASAKKRHRHMASYETGPARDQDRFTHQQIPVRTTYDRQSRLGVNSSL